MLRRSGDVRSRSGHPLLAEMPAPFNGQTGEPMPEGDGDVADEIADDIENAEGEDDLE
jgi:hypothetical protein